jgi:hypothetical protein
LNNTKHSIRITVRKLHARGIAARRDALELKKSMGCYTLQPRGDGAASAFRLGIWHLIKLVSPCIATCREERGITVITVITDHGITVTRPSIPFMPPDDGSRLGLRPRRVARANWRLSR